MPVSRERRAPAADPGRYPRDCPRGYNLGSETRRAQHEARCIVDSERSGHSWGTPVFAGTRVPVQTLFEYLEAGDSLDKFLDEFPSVSRERAIAVLEAAREGLAGSAHPSR